MRPGQILAVLSASLLLIAAQPRVMAHTLACKASSAPSSRAAAASLTIANFYPITAADAKRATTSRFTPPSNLSFRAGIKVVNFTFSWSHVAPDTSFQIVATDYSDGLTSSGPVNALPPGSGSGVLPLTQAAPFAQAVWRADLLIDGRLTASTSFAVGLHNIMTYFFTTNGAGAKTLAQQWLDGRDIPMVAGFPSGAAVTFLYGWIGAKPGATTLQLVLFDHNGNSFRNGKMLTATSQGPDANAETMQDLPDGTYHAYLEVNGAPSAVVAFKVGA